jgi:hypothetical protein
LEHFQKLIPRKILKGYEHADPFAARWKLPLGYSDYVPYISLIDLMVNDDVI